MQSFWKLNLVVYIITAELLPFNAGLVALYRPLLHHMLSVLAHRAVVNAFKDIVYVKSLCSSLCLEFKIPLLWV